MPLARIGSPVRATTPTAEIRRFKGVRALVPYRSDRSRSLLAAGREAKQEKLLTDEVVLPGEPAGALITCEDFVVTIL